MSEDESIKEILLNIRDYIQKSIDDGYHKFVYNDLGSDMKCVDIINAIETILDLYHHKKERIDKLKQELLQEKEKNKELSEELTVRICENVEAEVFEEMRLELKQEKEKNKSLQKEINLMKDYQKNAGVIFKDKIKEKIQEIKNGKENYVFHKLTSEDIRKTIITNLESLLEED